jgi:cation transport regulator ChaB
VPYKDITEIDAKVRAVLPVSAQKLYMAAYNAEWEKSKDEAKAHANAMGAVGRRYAKGPDGKWTLKESDTMRDLKALREASIELTPPNENGVSADSVLIRAGVNKTGRRLYTPEFLREALPRFDGAFCFVDHPSLDEEKTRPERSLLRMGARVSNPRWRESDQTVIGDVHYMGTGLGQEVRALFADEVVRERAGLSIYYPWGAKSKRIKVAEAWVDCPVSLQGGEKFDVDFVTRPSAGGKVGPIRESEEDMDLKELTMEELQAERADLIEAARAGYVLAESVEKPKPEEKDEAPPATGLSEADRERIEKLERRNRVLEGSEIVRLKLAEVADLPTAARALVESDFAGAECEDVTAFGERVAAKIAAVKTLAESLSEAGRVRGVAREQTGGTGEVDVRAGLRKAMGLPEPKAE